MTHKFPLRGRTGRLSLAGLLVLVGILASRFFFPARGSLEVLPEPDMSGAEAQVKEKIEFLRGEVVKNPDSAEAWGKLAMNLDVHDYKREALPCYKEAAKLNSKDFRWPYYLAIVLSEMGFPEALKWFERGRKLRPEYTPLHLLQGQMLFDLGRLERASEAFHRAIATDPNSSHAYLGLAQISLAEGDLETSRQFLTNALEIDGQHRQLHGLLAEVHRRVGKLELAAEELELARELPEVTPMVDPVYEQLVAEGVSAFWYRERGLVYQAKGMLEEAVREFKTALRLKGDAEGHNYVGELLRELGKHGESAIHFRAAVGLRRRYVEAYNNLAGALFEMGLLDPAIHYAYLALRINPAFPDAYLNLANFYKQAGSPAEAIDLLRQGLDYTPDNVVMTAELAWLLATSWQDTLRNGAEAVHLAKSVCEKTNYEVAEPLDVLAAAYAETGQFARAVSMVKKALELARSTDQTELANQLQSRLALYETNQPYREEKP